MKNFCRKCFKDIQIDEDHQSWCPEYRPPNQKKNESENMSTPIKTSQIKFDKNFIKKLLDKLKIGNARSIHLNAIPGRSATRLDLFQLEIIDGEMPSNFIETILTSEIFSFPISYDKVELSDLDEDEKKKLSLLAKRLNTLVIENTDNFLEFGLKNFGFGYPLLIKRDQNDPSKIIKAPLFIWHLDIERSYQNKNSWTIKKDEDSPIKINEILISHLTKDESVQVEKIPKEVLEDGILDKDELLELIRNILSQLNVKSEKLKLKIEKCPDAKQIENIANSKPWIQWSGIFGIYRSQNETIIHATEELLGRFDEFESENLILEQFQTSSISAVETDPSKEEIVNTLTKDEIKLIQGPPGTGKSQSITAIVSNALANSAKCLIVCEKKTALDVIQANLEKIGLSDFSIVIDDVNKDRKKVIEKARNIKDSLQYISFSSLDFKTKYKKFCELKKDINSKCAEPLRKVFGDYSWKQLIGLYLRHSKAGDLDQVTSSLSYDGFKFDHDEYYEYVNTIEEAGFLYDELENNSEETFSIFNDDLFSTEYKWATHGKVKENIAKLYEVLKSATLFLSEKNKSDCEKNGISLFRPESIHNCESSLRLAIDNSKKVIDLYEEGIELAGNKFNKKASWVDNIFYFVSLFNEKNKRVCFIRKEMLSLFRDILASISQVKEFNFEELELKNLEDLESYESIKNYIKDILVKNKKIETGIKKIKDIDKQLKGFDMQLEQAINSDILDCKTISYIDLGNYDAIFKYYSDLKNKIENVQQQLDAYESFHNWKFFCKNKNNLELQIISAFKNFPAKNWKNIFIAWYYRGALLNYEANTKVGFHKSDSKLQQLTALYNELGSEQIRQIKSIWGAIRNSEISSFAHNFNALYNLRKNKSFSRRNSLRKIIEADFNLFTSLFPIILTNPGAANAILPLEQGIFNIVIFDEASQLKISDTFTSLIRGQYKIIAGDEHQMPPSNYFQSAADMIIDDDEEDGAFSEEDEQDVLAEAESLLQYASDLKNINKSYLDFHYRSNHPALIEFSNSAFYGGNLISFPEQEVYRPIEFRPVNGRYETRTNPSEVAEILKIIGNEIHPNQKGKYPSVGIATFNINQRNLITEALNEAAEKDSAFATKLQELRERGLFVKNLENIQGDERDIIIISTTYGIQADGKFSQNFARLNRIEGYKLLNVLITRAKHKLYVCTSIPKEKYLSYPEIIKSEGNNKKGILYAYLAYAEAISNHDTELAEGILRNLKEQSFEKPRIISSTDGLSESPFEEEVYDLLLDHFKKEDIIQQHKIGGFRLDFVIKTKTRDVVLECDGKAYHQSEEAYAHDMYRQKELENMGFIVYRIWSTNWFQDKESEMKKLLRFIESLNC